MLDQFTNYIYYCRTSLILPISISLVFLLITFFGDPPYFPLSPNDDAVDCLNIDINRFYFDRSRIKINATLHNFIQYPKEIANTLLNIQVYSGRVKLFFNSTTFWDLESDLQNLSFCALSSVGGNLAAYLYCQNHYLRSTSTNLNFINAYHIGTTKILPSSNKYHLFNFGDACVCNSTFKILSNNIRVFPSFKFGSKDYLVSSSITNGVIKQFSPQAKTKLESSPFLIVSPISDYPLLDYVIPLIQTNFKIHVLGQSSEFVKSYLEGTNFNITNFNEKEMRCFSQAFFSRTYQSDNPLQEEKNEFERKAGFLRTLFSDQNISKLSSYPLMNRQISQNKTNSVFIKLIIEDKILDLIDDQNPKNYKKLSETLCPKNKKCEIISINQLNHTLKVAEQLKDADCLVVNSIENLFFAGFAQNKINLIEIESDNRIGHNYGKLVAQKLNINYHAINANQALKQDQKKCQNLECALQDQKITNEVIPVLINIIASLYK